jgi:hypothetical protein
MVVRENNNNNNQEETAMNSFGVNVWWHVPETSVELEVAQSALIKNGFDISAMKEPSRRSEVSRAVRSLQDRRTKDTQTISRPTGDNGLHVTYGVLSEGHVDDETVQFLQDTTIRLNKDTGEVGVTGARSEAAYAAVEHYTGKITDEDIRSFLRHIIKSCRGVAKRPTGGIYFVPEAFVSLIERAQAVLDEMNSGAHLYVEGVVNGIRERQNVWESVERNIEAELQKTLSSVERIERSTKYVKGHEAKVLALNEMMEVYTDILGQEAEHETISEKLAEASQTIAHKLTEMQSASATRVRKVASKSKRGSKVYDAAVDALTKAGTSMHYRDIMQAMVAAGSYEGSCPTSDRSVNDVIRRGIAKGDSRLKQVGRGVYSIS